MIQPSAQKIVLQGVDANFAYVHLLRIKSSSACKALIQFICQNRGVPFFDDNREPVGSDMLQEMSVGITFSGLIELGMREEFSAELWKRSPAFHAGAYYRAQERSLDTGANSPRFWDPQFRQGAHHIVLTIYSDSKSECERQLLDLCLMFPDAFEERSRNVYAIGCHLSAQDGPTGGRLEHFGFLDGISQPAIEGIHSSTEKKHALGEFVLGYKDDQGNNPWALNGSLRREEDESPADQVLRHRRFFRGSSFCAFRAMEQDVGGFQVYIEEQASILGASVEYVKAKMMGRWPNGAPLRPFQEKMPNSPPVEEVNSFDFSDDPVGMGCPFGSHVRRMNPRSDLVVPLRSRRLIRRGIPFGKALARGDEEEIRRDQGERIGEISVPRGFLGFFFCSDLTDQYEHILGEWGERRPMGLPTTGNSKDPIIGGNDRNKKFDFPMSMDERVELCGMKTFTRTIGTSYAIYLGRDGLSCLQDEEFFDRQ